MPCEHVSYDMQLSVKRAEGLHRWMSSRRMLLPYDGPEKSSLECEMSCATAGWTTSNDVAPAGPQGWAESDEWVDDSAAAAGRFFEAGTKPARPGSQGWASSSWSESSSFADDE